MTGNAADFRLDPNLVQHSFERAASTYDRVAILQYEVGSRMLERLDLIRISPQTIIDVGCGTGIVTTTLLKKYRKANVLGLDIAPAMLRIARKRAPWPHKLMRKLACICADAQSLPLANASCDMVISNLMLPWCNDPDSVFHEFRRVLTPGGLLLFSTLGPDTLKELRRSWAAVDAYQHVNAFIDMHDIGDALIRVGLAEPVMDVELITLTYSDVATLMQDLKQSGAHNVLAGRPPGLMGKDRLQAMYKAYEQFRQNGVLPATYEIVYGHAWGAHASPARQATGSVSVVPLSQLQQSRR